jgi:C4-dicarboxylate-specific signal transduction histidine kinase
MCGEMDSSQRNIDESEKMTALVQLAGTVAHELNNIFAAVTGNLSLLDQEIAEASNNPSATVKDIVRAAQRGIDLSSKLQAFAGRQRLDRRSIEVNAVVSRTMAKLRLTLMGVTVKIMLADAEFIVFADDQKLSDTIVELIKNACTAMPPGRGCLTIKTERRQRGNRPPHVLLSIADNGCGMTPEVAARAMEPLFTTSPHGVKAGWGLSNCAGFIRQSGGIMALASEPGSGTRIEISLPLESV